MTRQVEGRLTAALLAAGLLGLVAAQSAPALAAEAYRLTVTDLGNGQTLASLAVQEGQSWCIGWRHSVKGFEVADCYENRGGQMVLVRSRLPDFAAGLDHIPGRGRQVSDGMGGYWILDIDEAVPGNAYVLRPGGPAVDHRLRIGSQTLSLTAIGERARLRIGLEEAPGATGAGQ